MRSKVVNMLALALMLGGVGLALAQSPPREYPGAQPGQPATPPKQPGAPGGQKPKKPQAEPSKLEGMLAGALKNNPDIRVAAANLTLAEAELNRTRLQVTQKVLTLHHAILSQQATVDYEQKQFERMQRLLTTPGAVDQQLADERLAKLTVAKAKLAELESQIPGLLGKVARAEAESGVHKATVVHEAELTLRRQDLEDKLLALKKWEDVHKATGPMADRIRKALETPVKVDYKDVPFTDVLKDLEKKAPGLSIRDYARPNNFKVNLHFEEELPVSAVLQALTDFYQRLFLVRDYGLLATTQEYKPPPGAMTVDEFLRLKPADEPRHQPSSGKNPPPQAIEGLVKSTDASGLMRITIGSDAGLAKGHTLELFRLNPSAPTQTKYLGTVRILEVDAHQAVAQPVGRLSAPAQAGDRVTSRILSK